MNNNDSLSHTKWRCKYHIVFAPKYRRQEDIANDNVSAKEYLDPFPGEKVKK